MRRVGGRRSLPPRARPEVDGRRPWRSSRAAPPRGVHGEEDTGSWAGSLPRFVTPARTKVLPFPCSSKPPGGGGGRPPSLGGGSKTSGGLHPDIPHGGGRRDVRPRRRRGSRRRWREEQARTRGAEAPLLASGGGDRRLRRTRGGSSGCGVQGSGGRREAVGGGGIGTVVGPRGASRFRPIWRNRVPTGFSRERCRPPLRGRFPP
jgi:hypothetical protein